VKGEEYAGLKEAFVLAAEGAVLGDINREGGG